MGVRLSILEGQWGTGNGKTHREWWLRQTYVCAHLKRGWVPGWIVFKYTQDSSPIERGLLMKAAPH